MKKEEIKKDPIRDRIVSSIDYYNNNKNSFFKYFFIIASIVLIASYYNNSESLKNQNALKLSGSAQTLFANDNIDESLVKFERIIKDYKGTDAAVHSFVYLIANAVDNNDYNEILKTIELYSNNIDDIKDHVIKNSLYRVIGDIYINNKDLTEGIRYYKLADTDNNLLNIKTKIKMAKAYIELENYESAENIINEIFKDDNIPFNENNTAEELLAIIKHKINT
tara:strand:+ start:13 stop:681 length:669 start_codon:yes stop_codon:yes gene_type:complete